MIFLPQNKKQHFVPKFYFRNFSGDNQRFSVYNVAQKQCHPSVPYDDQCYKNYYYGSDTIWEKRLSAMEAEWGLTFQKILANSPLDGKDISLIKRFALYQMLRTVASNEYKIQEKEDLIREYMKMICEQRRITFTDETESLCQELAKKGTTSSEMLEYADECICLFDDLQITIVEYQTKQELITSDVPVIAINPFFQPSIGYACMGLIILFPISCNKLVVLYDAEMYVQNKGLLYVVCVDENEVSNLNALQVISANKILIAKHESSFSEILDTAWESRSMNRDQSAITSLGPKDQKMIITSLRKTIYDCNFSFGKVCHRFRRIPFVCKEAPPRKWDKGWEEKLKIKEKILPEIITHSPELQSQYGLTKKEIRKGCERMTAVAKVYWTKNGTITMNDL